MLLAGLGMRWLLIGDDFRFGARRAGDFALLQEASRKHGFGLEAMPTVEFEGVRVSSSAVRAERSSRSGDWRRRRRST